MKSIYWNFSALMRNVKKKKYYALFRTLFDSEYRKDILRMKDLTSRVEMDIGHGSIPLKSIRRGHDINYPLWVDQLVDQIKVKGWKSLEPIKIIWDPEKSQWLVVDGNHRFEALKRVLPSYVKIPALILMPKGMDKYQYMEKMFINLLHKGNRNFNNMNNSRLWQ